jgi:hypothetical protein
MIHTQSKRLKSDTAAASAPSWAMKPEHEVTSQGPDRAHEKTTALLSGETEQEFWKAAAETRVSITRQDHWTANKKAGTGLSRKMSVRNQGTPDTGIDCSRCCPVNWARGRMRPRAAGIGTRAANVPAKKNSTNEPTLSVRQ